jgi:hypothetical protein
MGRASALPVAGALRAQVPRAGRAVLAALYATRRVALPATATLGTLGLACDHCAFFGSSRRSFHQREVAMNGLGCKSANDHLLL